jgi:peptidoglycan/xylan/chitin deacetylase (PgdA/CDA1 family)
MGGSSTTQGSRGDRHGCAVLVYHRVGTSSSDPLRLNVTSANLASHLAVIASAWRPISLAELTSALRNGGEPPARSVAVTFDDGYTGVLADALPLLERYQVPATAFIVSGFVGQEFWWERLDALVRGSSSSPNRLKLEIGGWRLDLVRARLRALRYSIPVLDELYYMLMRRLRVVSPPTRARTMDQVAAWSGVEVELEPDRRPLSAEGVRELAASGVVEIGGHTTTHPVLAELDADSQSEEIGGGKAALERMIGAPITSFAYPYGGQSEYDRTAVGAVRDAGYQRACANVQGSVRAGAEIFELPRLIVGDWDGDTFAKQVEQWLGAASFTKEAART